MYMEYILYSVSVKNPDFDNYTEVMKDKISFTRKYAMKY